MYQIPDLSGGAQRGGGFNTAGPIGAGQFDFGSLGGMSSTENQYMNYPAMGSSIDGMATAPIMPGGAQTAPTPGVGGSPPGVVPPAGGGGAAPPYGYTNPGFSLNDPLVGGKHKLGGGATTEPTLDPNFTSQFYNWLQSQIGGGVTPFNLSAMLPSTGQATTPGSLTAPENPILQSLQQFYQTGTGGPLPGVLPMWTSEMQSMNIPIQQQLANIKEQFGARGALGSSEMAQAMETYGAQTAKDQEALLGQLSLQALPGMESFGAGLQEMDQASIDRMVQEFIRTQPQYNPLLSTEAGLATTFSPLYGHTGFGAAFGQQFGAGLGGGLAKAITGG